MAAPKPSAVTIVSLSVGSEFYGLGSDQRVYKYVRRYGGDSGHKFDDAVMEWVLVQL